MEQLPLQLALAPGESGLGFVLRALQAHAVPFRRGVQWLKLRRDTPLDESELRHAAWALNVDAQEFAERVLTVDFGHGRQWVRLGGQRFRRHVATTVHYAKLCPACVRQHGVARTSWLLRATVGCAWHGYSLITHCSRCKAPIRWARPAVDICACGFPLRESEQVMPLEPEVQAWLAWLEHCLAPSDMRAAALRTEQKLPEPLQSLSIDGSFRLAEALGLLDNWRESVRSARRRQRAERDAGAVIARGLVRLGLICKDPSAAAEVLNNAALTALDEVARDGGTQADARLASWLMEVRRAEALPPALGYGVRPTGQLPLFV